MHVLVLSCHPVETSFHAEVLKNLAMTRFAA
jgi:hypothetical protein